MRRFALILLMVSLPARAVSPEGRAAEVLADALLPRLLASEPGRALVARLGLPAGIEGEAFLRALDSRGVSRDFLDRFLQLRSRMSTHPLRSIDEAGVFARVAGQEFALAAEGSAASAEIFAPRAAIRISRYLETRARFVEPEVFDFREELGAITRLADQLEVSAGIIRGQIAAGRVEYPRFLSTRYETQFGAAMHHLDEAFVMMERHWLEYGVFSRRGELRDLVGRLERLRPSLVHPEIGLERQARADEEALAVLRDLLP